MVPRGLDASAGARILAGALALASLAPPAPAFEGRAIPEEELGFLFAGPEPGVPPIAERLGLLPREIHRSLDGRVALVLWAPFHRGDLVMPEVWVRDPEAGPTRVWPERPGMVEWSSPRLEIRRRDRTLLVRVDDLLLGENQEEPHLPRRRLYAVGTSGPRLLRQRVAPATTPSQHLNLLAAALQDQDPGGVAREVSAVRSSARAIRLRAAALLADARARSPDPRGPVALRDAVPLLATRPEGRSP